MSGADGSGKPGVDLEEIERCAQLLERLVESRGGLAEVPQQLRMRLLMAAGQLSRPTRAERRTLAKAFRRNERNARKEADETRLAATGIRTLRREPTFVTPRPFLAPSVDASADETRLEDERKCYVCKASFDEVHFFYCSMCPSCAELNWRKRNQSADLHGRIALVTGARVKIGYQASIKLLRAGARVIVTTRFPADAATRYASEPDFESFRGRLEIHGLDLRHTPSVEAFARALEPRLPHLDFILNNACQTVRRPPGFYSHLLAAEEGHRNALPPEARDLLARVASALPLSSAMTQLELAPGDELRGEHLFPSGALDADLQQIDRREINSWRLPMAEVPTVELLEVYLVNAVAPFVLNARLKPAMMRNPSGDRHIVNVSAVEGQFYRSFKTDKHPHTNMAKAALNMMTRTSAADYVRDGIHMNSVDTGWVTDEDPIAIADRKRTEHGFHPPLDIVDGAARICDPFFDGLLTGKHAWGVFFKDYAPTPW